MILVDSNIIIDFWRTGKAKYAEIFRTKPVCICELVRTELLRGARSEEEFAEIRNAIERFPVLEMSGEDWDALGHDLFILRSNGISVPFQDAIIARIAAKYKVPIWTKDRHFDLIAKILPDIALL